MTYIFKHPTITDNERIDLGEDHYKALATLQEEYGLDLESIFCFCMDGYIVEVEA